VTRINVIPPSHLADQHLLAELRELPRTFGLVHRTGDPESYRMGKGHVRFFADKPNWLRNRQRDLHTEALARGFKPSYQPPESTGPDEWAPDDDAININLERLQERLAGKPGFYRYFGHRVWSDFYGSTR
jgi:deoxyribonuclease (pyrimidine dimer)